MDWLRLHEHRYFDASDGASTNTGYRLLRCHKNRFGPTDEVGVFSMARQGLVSITGTTVRNNMEQVCIYKMMNSAFKNDESLH